MTSGEQAILRTVAYFDIFNYPLTAWEIWKWQLGSQATQLEYPLVAEALQSSAILQEKLGHHQGFFFLRGRADNVRLRQERYRLALTKLERAQRFAQTLARIPYVRAVFACNSLGLANARTESDIDFFIIVQRGHVWAVRLLAAGWAKLRKLRPRPANRQDTFCLSFFLADDALDLGKLRLPADPYLTMWLATLVPLYDPANLRTQVWRENAWVQAALPHAQPRDLSAMRSAQAWRAPWARPLIGRRWFERLAERIQQRVLAPNLRALANQDSRVVMTAAMLKFHDNDRREEYARQFQDKLAALGLPA